MEDTSKTNKTENNDKTNENNQQLIDDMSKMLTPGGMSFNRKKKQDEEEIKNKVGKFWGNQPVPQFKGGKVTEKDIGPIETNCDVEKEDKEPVFLPKGYAWWDVDINNDADLTKVSKLKIYIYDYTYTNIT